MRLRGEQLAVTATCLVASLAYAGAVTTWALASFVLPGVALAALIAWPLVARRMSGTTLIVGGLLVLGWAELANIWTGTTNGPAARSTFVAGGCSLVAAVAAGSRRPALFLAPVAGAVAGALILGAGGEVPVVAIAAAVCAALTLGWVERARRNWTQPPRHGPALVLLSLLVGAAAVGIVLVQTQSDPRQPEVLAQGRTYPGIKPAWSDPLVSTSKSPGITSRQPRASAEPTTATRHRPAGTRQRISTPPRTHSSRPSSAAARPGHSPQSRIWLYVLAATVLMMLALALLVAARLLAMRLEWRRVRQRLAVGPAAEQVTGAWAWTRLRLEACRLPLGVDVSPDAVAAGRATDALPPELFTPLHRLATMTTSAAFAREHSVGATEVSAAWTAARQAEASARELLTKRGRVGLAFRSPTPRTGAGR